MICLLLLGLSLAHTLYVQPFPQSKILQMPRRQAGEIILREYGPLNLNDDMVKFARQGAPYHSAAENSHNPYLWLKPEDAFKQNGYYTPHNPWGTPPAGAGAAPGEPTNYGYFYHPPPPTGYYGTDTEYPSDYSAYGYPGYGYPGGPSSGGGPNSSGSGPNSSGSGGNSNTNTNNNNGGQNQGGQPNNNNQPPSASTNNNPETGNSNPNDGGNSNPGSNPEDGAVCPPGYICVKISDIPPQGGHVSADTSASSPGSDNNTDGQQGVVMRRLGAPRHLPIYAPQQRLLRKPQAADLQCLSAINTNHRRSLILGFCGQPAPKALSLANDCSTVGYSSRASSFNSARSIAVEKCTKLCQTTNCKGHCNVLSASSEQICSLLQQIQAILG